jgi:hypothetical protein
MGPSPKYFAMAVLAALLMFQNCSPFGARKATSSKQDIVSRAVFATATTSTSAEYTGSDDPVTIPVDSNCVNGSCTVGIQNQTKTLEIPVLYYCSNNWSTQILENESILDSQSLKAIFVNSTGQTVCEVSGPEIHQGVVAEKKLRLNFAQGTCPGLVDGRYTLLVRDAARKTEPFNVDGRIARQSILIGNKNHDSDKPFIIDIKTDSESGKLTFTPVANIGKKGEPATAYILWKDADKGLPTQSVGNDDVSRDANHNALCDVRNSPLVVQLAAQPRKIRLTNPLLGILFDIIGINDTPAHSKRKISWFSQRDAVDHYWITLPNTAGKVEGIDQLFGNNTVGPDGRTASDGYAALAKFDANRDGQITKADPVFSKLRFWTDQNVNGTAEPVELYTATDLAIVRVDLQYDPHYSETDKWGNEIKMKSVVETYDRKLHLMYDIWFRKVD